MNYKYFFICTAFLLLCSCNQQVDTQLFPNHQDYHILKVSLEETNTSLFDIFEKIELVPLETNDESLIKQIVKVKYYQNCFYVLDNQNALFFYNHTGKYLNKIHRIGQGPGEYQLIYDFFIDTLQSQVGMLSPYGSVFHYNFQGVFIKKTDLPHPPPSYGNVELFSDSTYLLWSSVPFGEFEGLNIVSMETGEKIGGFIYNEHPVFSTWSQVFYRDDKGNVYLTRGFSNDVFIVTPEGLEIAYSWDFGKRNNNIEKLRLSNSLQEMNETAQRFRDSFWNGESSVSYLLSLQHQTDLYYYATMWFAFRKMKHLFYHKQTGKFHLFERTTEGVSIERPLLITDEFMLAELGFENKESIAPWLFSDDDRKKLADFQEEDNPYLLKFTFKR